MRIFNDYIEYSFGINSSTGGASIGFGYSNLIPPNNSLIVQGNVSIGTSLTNNIGLSIKNGLYVLSGITTLGQTLNLNSNLVDFFNSEGTPGQVLTSFGNGVAWSTVALTGVVTGIIAQNQIAFGAGNSQIQGNSTFIRNGLGSVGIGTATPQYFLVVEGNANITNTLLLNNGYINQGTGYNTNIVLTGSLTDSNNSSGFSNWVLTSTGSAIIWNPVSNIGILTGLGTPNTVPKYGTPGGSLVNSSITDNGSAVSISEATVINNTLTVTGNTYIQGSAIVSGGFTVLGTSTIIQTQYLNVYDPIISLGDESVAYDTYIRGVVIEYFPISGIGTTGFMGVAAPNYDTLSYYNQIQYAGTAPTNSAFITLGNSLFNTGWFLGNLSVAGLGVVTNLIVTNYHLMQSGYTNQGTGYNTNISITGALYDSTGSVGFANSVLSSNGSAIIWQSPVTGIVTATGNFSGNEILFAANSSSLTGVNTFVYISGLVGLGVTNPTNLLTVAGGDALIQTMTIGFGSGNLNTNTIVGNAAGQNITTGAFNVMIGQLAGQWYTTGASNVIIGQEAGQGGPVHANTGGGNVLVGRFTGQYYNSANTVAIGEGALQGNNLLIIGTIGNNVAIGYQAAQFCKTLSESVVIGVNVLQGSGTTANISYNSTVIGYQACQNINSVTNTILGYQACQGLANTFLTSYIGFSSNTILGYQAGQYLASNNNVIIGHNALQGSATTFVNGSGNIAIGYLVANNFYYGNNNIFLGYSANGVNSGSYQIAIGFAVTTTASNLGAWGGNTTTTYTHLGIGSYTPVGRVHIETLVSSNLGLYIAGANSQTANLLQIDQSTLGNNYITVNNIGNLGVGTAFPQTNAHVVGTSRVDGTFIVNAEAADLRNQRIFAGANLSTSLISYTGIASIFVPSGYCLTIEGKINGFSTSLTFSECGTYVASFYNIGIGVILIDAVDIFSKYVGTSSGNYTVTGIGSYVTVVVKSDPSASLWYWRTNYDYLLTQNS